MQEKANKYEVIDGCTRFEMEEPTSFDTFFLGKKEWAT